MNGRLIVVAGSRGGAGTSCLAAALANAVQSKTQRAVLVDLCEGSAGLEVLLGIEGEPGARWPEIEAARGEINGNELMLALPQWQGVPVLSVSRRHPGALPDEVVLDVCAGLLRSGAIVVLDIPGAAAWTPATRALIIDADQVLITTPDSTVGLAGAVALALAIDQLKPGRGDPDKPEEVQQFRRRRLPKADQAIALRSRPGSRVAESDVTELVGLPVMVRFRDDRNLATALELGMGPAKKAAKRLTKASQTIAGEVIGL